MKKMSGFSLMEMMVVLLITAIVAAATAPMISRKMVAGAGDKCPWTAIKGGIGYTLKNTGTNIGVAIGTGKFPDTKPLFLLRTSDKTRPFMTFAGAGKEVELKMNDTSIILGKMTNDDVPKNTIAIGKEDMTITGDDSISLGSGVKVNGKGGIAIGYKAITDENSIAIGTGDVVSSAANTIAIGHKTKSPFANSVTIGYDAQSKASNSVTIGSGSQSTGQFGLALGDGTTAASYGIALGNEATAGSKSIAIGTKTVTNDLGAIAIGNGATSDYYDAIAIGNKSTSAQTSVAVGEGANARDFGAIAIGDDSDATEYSISVGRGATSATNGVAIGYDMSAAHSAVALGRSSNATGQGAVSIGYKTIASGSWSTALGQEAEATARDASALGTEAYATAENSTAVGSNSKAHGSHSSSLGYNARAQHSYSTAIGYGAQTTKSNQVVLGSSNAEVYMPGPRITASGNTITLGDSNSTINIAGTLNVTGTLKTYSLGVQYLTVSQQGTITDLNIRNKNASGYVYGAGAFDYSGTELRVTGSDRRLKNVGKAFTGGLDKIRKLEVFNYTYKADKKKIPHVGVMAQDLQKIFPDAVFKGEDGFFRIRMEDMFYALVNAVKEIDAILTSHDKKIQELTKQNQDLTKQVTALEKRLADLEKKVK